MAARLRPLRTFAPHRGLEQCHDDKRTLLHRFFPVIHRKTPFLSLDILTGESRQYSAGAEPMLSQRRKGPHMMVWNDEAFLQAGTLQNYLSRMPPTGTRRTRI